MDIKTRLPQNLFPKLSECINLSVPITECDLSYKDHDLSIRTLIKYYKILTEQGYTKTKATNGWERLAAGLYRNNGTIGGGPMDNGPHYNGANQHEQRWLARHRMANSVGGLETIKWSQEFFSDRNPQTKNRSLASRFRALHDGLSRGDGKGNNLLRSLRESLSPPPGALRFGDRMIYIDEIIPVHELNYEHSANRPCRPIKRYGTEKRPPIGGTSMSQWVFIDLPTLAIMSCNYTESDHLSFGRYSTSMPRSQGYQPSGKQAPTPKSHISPQQGSNTTQSGRSSTGSGISGASGHTTLHSPSNTQEEPVGGHTSAHN